MLVAAMLASVAGTDTSVTAAAHEQEPEELVPILRIGQDDGVAASSDGAFLYEPRAVAITPDNKLFVFDAGNHRIAVFDALTGHFLDAFGRAGQGPGEFAADRHQAFDDLSLTEARVSVVELVVRRVHVFTLEGSHVTTFAMASEPRSIFLANESVYVSVVPNRQGQKTISVFGLDGQLTREFGEPRFGSDRDLSEDRQVRLANESMATAGAGRIAQAFTYFPLVVIYDEEGNELDSELLDFGWWDAPGLQEKREWLNVEDRVKRIAESANALEDEDFRRPLVVDIESLPDIGGWVLLLNGAIVQGLSRALEPLQYYSLGVSIMDIALSPDGSLLCGVDVIEHAVLCFRLPAWALE